jgi:hypothetical protein
MCDEPMTHERMRSVRVCECVWGGGDVGRLYVLHIAHGMLYVCMCRSCVCVWPVPMCVPLVLCGVWLWGAVVTGCAWRHTRPRHA